MCDTDVLECVEDNELSTPEIKVLRCNLNNATEAEQWMRSYSAETNTSWIVDYVVTKCARMVFRKVWRCQHHHRNKMTARRTTDCPAKIDIKIKKVNPNTQKNDEYLRRSTPLPAVIKLAAAHNHSTVCADSLKLLRASPETRATFEAYFEAGFTPAAAIRHHEEALALEDNSHILLANSMLNPQQRTVYYWHQEWRLAKHGPLSNPLPKLQEKLADYAAQGRPSKLWEETNPDWAPSLLLGYSSRHADPACYDRAKRRRLQEDEADAASAAVSAAIAESTGTDTDDTVEGQPPPGDEDESGTEENAPGVAAQTELTSVGLQALETQCLALNDALYTARSENEQLQLSKAAFQGCEAKVIFYTGMPNFTQLNSLFEVLESHVSHNVNNSLSKFQEFILFLMKLKLNLHNVDLGFRFGVSEATVCRIFDKWLHCAYCRLKTQIVWPDRTALRRTMPQAFCDAFGDGVSVIIDCFELKIERPSSFLPRSETWSLYKGSNTAKFLIGIAPTGVVTFISEGWGGRTTDRHITEHCGLLDYLLPGDVVLADRGFNISESVGFYCARLHIPAFTRGKKQLSAEEVESTRKLANVRIHVERVIGLIRNKFVILKSTLPIDYVTCQPGDELAPIDKIVTVCCALSNLCPSIVAELKDTNESP
ncbi:uncharacterized protein LOC119462177 isoform X1 [Dermacentor silvarum]|uniref:uncharacterized protein LOC119462177 isoform X1 n=1 Tax=Dermacentor silvarum TaxID=543639 RepID=UPI0021009AB6|nr:uncharacterized protein LOC119462177 isoform X1 [Dermacentor silvarum]